MYELHSNFAAKHTRLTLDQNRLLEDGESVRVYGIVASNNTASPAIIEIARARQTGSLGFYIHRWAVPANDSKEFHSQWLASQGVRVNAVSASSDVEVTFFHSHGGA